MSLGGLRGHRGQSRATPFITHLAVSYPAGTRVGEGKGGGVL